MRTKLAFLALAVLFPLFLAAQETLEGKVRGMEGGKVFLLSLYGERTTRIDSTVADSAGKFRFSMAGRLPGTYRVYWGKEGSLDLIWNRENVRFSATATNPSDSLEIITSVENKINQAFARLDRINQEKLQLLIPILDYYPVQDSFYAATAREMETIQNRQAAYLDSLAKQYPDAYAVRIARVYQGPFIPATLVREQRMNFLKTHYFDKTDFKDTALLRSTVFANKAISYLAMYSNSRLQQKQLETEFIKAVTVMLGAASVNPEVFKFWLDYLVGGFDKYHFDDVITYIADNFQDPFSCEDQQRKTALQKKLETFKKIAVGKTAPEISAPDPKGKTFTLSGIPSEYTLVLFWSSECPHCATMMPRLKEIYEKQKPKRFEVFSVSIDTSRTAWTGFLKEQKLNWINVSDLKGFNGKPADDFNIYATPTMFLLDREKKILAKPISQQELENVLRDYQLMK